MTTFQQYVSQLAPGRTYVLAIPELSYSRYRGDLTAAKDFYLYSLTTPDEVINRTADAWTAQSDDTSGVYLLPAALSYLAAAAKENGHIILDVAVPGWDSIAYEALPFLYIDNDKMIFEQKPDAGIQLLVRHPESDDLNCHIFLDLRSNGKAVGEAGVFRIKRNKSEPSPRNYTFLQEDFVHTIQADRAFCEKIDQIFVADVFARCLKTQPPWQPTPDSAMRQMLAYLSNIWDDTQGRRGYNIAAALAEMDGDGRFRFLLLVPNEKKRSRIAHAETRVVSFMNVVCRDDDWVEDSAVVRYIARLSRLAAETIVQIKAQFLTADKGAEALAFFSSFQPCYMCRAEPDGATIDRIASLSTGGRTLQILPDGTTLLRSSFGGQYLDRMEVLYYYDMDSNVFYPRDVSDEIVTQDGRSKLVWLKQLATTGYVSPEGRAIFGPVAIGNAKEDYATAATKERIRNSSFLGLAGDGMLGFAVDSNVDYSLAGPEQAPATSLPIGMTTKLAGVALSQTATESGSADTLARADTDSGPPATAGDATPAPARSGQLTTEQIRLLQRAAVLLGTLGQG